jgi:hypothetical protein
LKPDLRKAKPKKTESLDEEAEVIECDKCDFLTTVAETLRKHIRSKQNILQGVIIQTDCRKEI